MAGFLRAATIVLAGGMIAGAGALMLLPPAAEGPLFARARIPDPPALPCKKQAWPNTDRNCVAWTAPRPEAVKADAGRAPPRAGAVEQALVSVRAPVQPEAERNDQPAAATPQIMVLADVAPSASALQPSPQAAAPDVPLAATPAHVRLATTTNETPAGEPAPPVRAAPRDRPEASPTARRANGQASVIPVTAYGADGMRRTIVIRPTSRQDVYYYARRNFAAINPVVPR